MFSSNYFKAKYFSSYFRAQVVLEFTGGQLSYATLRYFDYEVSRVFQDIALNPAILTDVVKDIIFDSQTVDIEFTSESSADSFINSVETMIITNTTTNVSDEDKAVVRSFINSAIVRK
jgi:hypothetical protein